MSARDEADGFRDVVGARIRGVGGSTLAKEAVFDLAGGTAAVTVLFIAIVTGKNEAYSITAPLVTHIFSIQGKAFRANFTREAILAAVATCWAWFTSELLLIPVCADGAFDGMTDNLAVRA